MWPAVDRSSPASDLQNDITFLYDGGSGSEIPQPQPDLLVNFDTPAPPIDASKSKPKKACDSCSSRKIRCGGDTIPCIPCKNLDIVCTFHRPSRRRGPASKYAAVIPPYEPRRPRPPSAPSAARTTASQRPVLSPSPAQVSPLTPSLAESICDVQTLQVLIDDYFMYIHPLIPLPHEPSFRAAFARRDDRVDRGFVSLLAAMIEVLVASFPRRPLRLFTSDQAKKNYPNAGALIDQCHQAFNEARGLGFVDREASLTDALSSYLVGLAAGYQFGMSRQRRYMSECVVILRTLGFQRGLDPSQSETSIDHVYQQSGRRLFWLCFASSLSVRQLGGYDSDILMPPTAYSEKLPPLPAEVDDEYIYPSTIFSQPSNIVSTLCGFNLNVRLFRSFHKLIALEALFGGDTVYNWNRQCQIIHQALAEVKAITLDAPQVLRVGMASGSTDRSALSQDQSLPVTPQDNEGGSQTWANGQSAHASVGSAQPGRYQQYEIQKANIYATQLATRSFLVERYWNLLEIRRREQTPGSPPHVERLASAVSPTARCVASGLAARYSQSEQSVSEWQLDEGEPALAIEREDIIRDMAILLKSIDQISMEPSGLSICNKIRQVASTLLNQDRSRMLVMPSLDAESANKYLYEFCNILAKLERLGPQLIRDSGQRGRTTQDAEDEALVHWASLKEHQERFIRSEGFLANANV